MITDKDDSMIYFSELLKNDSKYSKTCKNLTEILDSYSIEYHFLPGTNDIWARDYMPIQVSVDKFIEYRFDPDYLQAVKWRYLKTHPDIGCDAIKLKTVKTDIILDGGNIIKSHDKVILTDKAVKENMKKYTEQELVQELKRLFEVEKVILIPWDKNEPYGHADGMIRFVDDYNVVVNGYFDDYDEAFKNKFFSVLDDNGIRYQKLIYSVKNPDIDRNWAYINYLQTKDILLLPGLGIEEDRQAMEQFENLFPDYAKRKRIIQVDVSPLVAEGGALNCISWTICNA
ncbi:MAG TPA: agmatine deiminase family protein [Spirochaetota bacterium]|nr:agmatine deiminase family protein [Spirochaetota bacterium]